MAAAPFVAERTATSVADRYLDRQPRPRCQPPASLLFLALRPSSATALQPLSGCSGRLPTGWSRFARRLHARAETTDDLRWHDYAG
jgi:hypothetical protein